MNDVVKRALLVSESSVYLDDNGKLISRGGGETCFHNIAKGLLRIGIQPVVFAIREFVGQKEEEMIDGVLYKRVAVFSRTSPKILKYLRAALKESKGYDYVFMNQFTPHLILPLLGRGFDQKKIVVVHDVYQGEGKDFWAQQYGVLTGMIGNFVEKLQLRFDRKHADKIMTVSEGGRAKLSEFLDGAGAKASAEKIFVNPFPIDARDYISDAEKEDFMLFVGRFVEYKHPEHVLYALKKVRERWPGFKAVFVVARVNKLALEKFRVVQNELGLSDEDVVLREGCSMEEVKDLLGRAKVLVQPSYVEGQGIIILEALASKAPVVAYDLEAYKGMLIGGVNCELVAKGDVERFADACACVLERHEVYRDGCGVTLRDFSTERFAEILSDALRNS
jgi:glycosyltransferase involved in cell wall biosynthesis